MVAIKVRDLIEREVSDSLVSKWEVQNNTIIQKHRVEKSYSFGKFFILLTVHVRLALF
jgi:hypothetical protein